jgi:hypothetical protein
MTHRPVCRSRATSSAERIDAAARKPGEPVGRSRRARLRRTTSSTRR